VAIAAGGGHNLALSSNGTVTAWGSNDYVPSGLSNIVAIAAGSNHSLALKSDGTVAGWGWNAYGQASPPVGLSNVVAIAAGGTHSLAITALLRIDSIEIINGNAVVSFRTFTGQDYVVEYSPDLNTPKWKALPAGAIQGDGHIARVTDFSTSDASRFYRVRQIQ
jgi:hypothetical protein